MKGFLSFTPVDGWIFSFVFDFNYGLICDATLVRLTVSLCI